MTWADYSRGFDFEREDVTSQYKYYEGKSGLSVLLSLYIKPSY